MTNMARCYAAEPTEEQFLQPISYSTCRCMKFPTKFYKKYVEGKNKDEFVSLKSPLLSTPWKVKIVGGKLKDGWSAFVKLHDLNVGDYVLFTHEGNLVFYVTTFSGKGNRILYAGKNNNSSSTASGTALGHKRKIENVTDDSGNRVRPRGKGGILIKETGGSASGRQEIKESANSVSVNSASFVQTVTKANLRSNSVYIPTKFTMENRLKERKSNFLGLLNSKDDVWCCQASRCTDGRLKILGGWEAFCIDNNIKQGDCCEFRLQPDKEDIMLKLVAVLKDGKKAVKGMDSSFGKAKEEQYEVDEDDGPGIDFEAMIHDIEGDYKEFVGKATFEKGEGSRK